MDQFIGRLLGLPRTAKQALVFMLDALIVIWSVYAAFYLRLGVWMHLVDSQLWAVGCALALAMPLFIIGGFYRAIFRHAGLSSMLLIIRMALIYGAFYSLIFTFWSVPEVPRTLGLIQPILLFILVGATRAFAHYLLGRRYRRFNVSNVTQSVLIYGAGDTGRQLARSLRINRDLHVVGFIDDDASLQNGRMDGLPIFSRDRLDALIALHQVSEILLALPSASRSRRREIIDWLGLRPLTVKIVPALNDLASGRVSANEIRPLVIEDLLGRQPVLPDWDLLRRPILGKCVLVTGAGGSIGSELARQIMALQPKALILVDVSEHALYQIDRELRRGGVIAGVVVPLLASVRDRNRLDAIFTQYAPDTVFHAAAYKHVPLVEENYLEGLKNNFMGTKTVGELALKHGVGDVVLISTDKAVRPTNMMGATKRLAELAFQTIGHVGALQSRFSVVRFGNVLNSAGSVVPLFQEQIEAGGPITITHPDITRYFMTIPEAAQLVLQAAAMSRGGGELFLLDMGQPVKILDLAKLMIQLSNLSLRDKDNAFGDIEIRSTGLRPGEKLYEELLIGAEAQPTEHPRIFRAHEPTNVVTDVPESLAVLEQAILRSDVEEVVRQISLLVEGYEPSGQYIDVEAFHGRIAPTKGYESVV